MKYVIFSCLIALCSIGQIQSQAAPTFPTDLTLLELLKLGQFITAYNVLAAKYLTFATRGVSIQSPITNTISTSILTLPGNSTIDLGLLTLPLYVLCNESFTPIHGIVSHVCDEDCTYIHNRYGGQCQILDSDRDEYSGTYQTPQRVCVCSDFPLPGVTQSQYKNPTSRNANFTIISERIDAVLDYAIYTAFRARSLAVQCTPAQINADAANNGSIVGPVSSGCAVDCSTNHQYYSGTCHTIPDSEISVPYPEDPTQNTKCLCNYNTQV